MDENKIGPISRIFAIAKNTFRESVRDRVLYNLIVFVLLITACAILLGDLTDGQEARTIVNIGLNAMLLFGVFIAIFVGVGLVSKEIEKRTVFAMFAKPTTRTEFVIGKYLGLCLTLAVNVAVMSAGVVLALLYVGGSSLISATLASVLLIYLELVVITAVAILFSSFSSAALSTLLAFLVFIIGHLSSSLRDLGETIGSRSASLALDVLYYVMPNLSLFAFRTEAANGLMPSVGYASSAAVYAIAYASVLIAVSTIIFSRRNFK